MFYCLFNDLFNKENIDLYFSDKQQVMKGWFFSSAIHKIAELKAAKKTSKNKNSTNEKDN